MHPYSFHCNCCGRKTPHIVNRHSSGEKLWQCLKCGEFNLSIPMQRRTKKVLPNPVSGGSLDNLQNAIERASKLAEEFSGHKPKRVKRHKISTNPPVRVTIGTVTGIMYLARRDGETKEYLHRFAKGSRPSLVVTPDGKRIELLGGAFKFTDRGIVDLKRKP